MTRRMLVVLALLTTATDVRGQVAGGPNRQRPEPLRIDPLTATISGRISTADTGAPIRRAEVRAISDRGLTRLATTDDDGRFVVRDLPAGSFTVLASKSGFVPLYFGQRRPFERRATILLTEGQRGSAPPNRCGAERHVEAPPGSPLPACGERARACPGEGRG